MNIGVQFKNMQSEDGSWTNGDTFFGGEATEGDQVFLLDAAQWDLSQSDKLGTDLGWMYTPADRGATEYFASLKFAKGDLLYYAPTAASSTLVSGQVAAVGEQSVTFDVDNEDGQWLFPLVNPFPVDTTWGEINAFTKEGDQIFALDSNQWDLTQYDRLGDGLGWMLTPADRSATEYITNEKAIALPAGGAAYYAPTETVTWTVTL